MKNIKKSLILFSTLALLSGCGKFHTGKVVVDENGKSKSSSNINVQYILVDQKDKDTLIKNIKDGKGAVITRDRNKQKEDKNENEQNSEVDNQNNSENR